MAGMEGDAVVHGRRGRGRGMADVLEGGVVLQVVAHHGMLWRRVRVARRTAGHDLCIVVVVVQVLLTHEVLRALVLVGAAILQRAVSGCVGGKQDAGSSIRIGSGRWSR